jgi:hypothetical protein
MLILYEYALSYSLRERVLKLRSELQIADHVLGFIDLSTPLSEANISLIRITSQSIYDSIEDLLGHHSTEDLTLPISEKEVPLA